ncbi:NAD-binding protein [Mycena galopus ATCC 62051]|nr:NAD-binding protein [Mycena galopus ATCC 62051]
MASRGIALITGAGQGIGRAIALRLASDGFNLAVNDIVSNARNLTQVVDEIKAVGRVASAHIADVSMENEVHNMVEEVVRAHGGLDVVCAQSYVSTVEEWNRMMTVNAQGTFLCYKYAALQMVSQGRGGRIIGASSVNGKKGSGFTSAYSAAKFAVRGLTQAAAMEFGSHGITVNAYAPGIIETDMKATGGTPGAYIQNVSAVPKPVTPDDIAGLVSYIASKESHFVTGAYQLLFISIDGGTYFD